ncbi:MAG: hypothetical protein HY761_04795 [Candidatus Omnitrophica bacterium]|nr:hypothetical protein [Candidatus Omnitrophota bacterium]
MFKSKQLQLLMMFVSCEIVLLTIPYSGWAYVDPNTGGFFFTTVLPFVYGMLGVVVIFWKRIVNFIKNKFTKKKD